MKVEFQGIYNTLYGSIKVNNTLYIVVKKRMEGNKLCMLQQR